MLIFVFVLFYLWCCCCCLYLFIFVVVFVYIYICCCARIHNSICLFYICFICCYICLYLFVVVDNLIKDLIMNKYFSARFQSVRSAICTHTFWAMRFWDRLVQTFLKIASHKSKFMAQSLWVQIAVLTIHFFITQNIYSN